LDLRCTDEAVYTRPEVLVTYGDVTEEEVRARVVQRTVAAYGRIDALVNSAGVGLYAWPTTVPVPLFSRLLDVNVVAPLALTKLVVPIMRYQREGTIVNIGSVAGLVALPWAAAYSASKFALDAVSDSLRRELRHESIHVINVYPGIVATDFRAHTLEGAAPPRVEQIRFVVSPDVVAAKICTAIEHRTKTVFVPRIGRIFAMLGATAPWLMDWFLSRYALPLKQATSRSAIPAAGGE
jgi:short-subunit dehydrogenase